MPYYVMKKSVTDFIHENVVYPSNDTLKGTVVVGFNVDTIGRTYGHYIIKGMGNPYNDEALRVCRMIRFDSPCYDSRGMPVEVKYHVPVRFTNEKKRESFFISLWKKIFPRSGRFAPVQADLQSSCNEKGICNPQPTNKEKASSKHENE